MGGMRNRGAMWWCPAAAFVVPASLWATAAAAIVPGAAPASTAAVENGLFVTGTGEVLYDSNILRTVVPSLLNGAHRDDFRYSPSGSLTYNHNVGRLAVSANGLVGHDFFQFNKYLDRNRFTGDGSVTYRSGSSCQAVANGSYSSRQGGVGGLNVAGIDPTNNPDGVGRVIDNVQDTSLYGASASCGAPSGRLSLGASYFHSSLRNGSPVRKFVDSDNDTFSGNVGIGILRPGQIGITGSYSTIGYPNRLTGAGIFIPPQFLSTGVRTYRIGLTLTRPIGTRLSGTFGVSYLHADPVGAGQPYSAPAYNAALTYTSSQKLTFSLVGSRSAIASNGAGAVFRVVDQVLFDANYSLGQAISINANLGFIRNNYKQSFAIPGEPARVNEITKTAGINVTYAPRQLYDVTLGVSHAMRSADPSLFNYNSTKASLTLAVHI